MTETPAKRCIWSHEKSDRAREVTLTTLDRFGRKPLEETVHVLPEHEQALRDFNTYFVENARLFLILIAAACLAPLVVLLLLTVEMIGETTGLLVAALSVIALGAVVLRFPFVTPETVKLFRIARSIRIARVSGGIVIVVGLGVMSLPLFI